MTERERIAWAIAQRRVAALQPDVQRAILRAFAVLRASVTDAEFVRLVESGRVERWFATVLSDATFDRAFLPVRQRLRLTTERGFAYTAPSLPGSGKVDGVLAVAFDHLSPDVVHAIRTLETSVITGLTDDTRETVRAFVENGLQDGVHPRTVARELRSVIGLSPTQADHAAKYEAKLRGATDPLPEARIVRRVETYRKRAIALNADTVSRTATLDAYKQGQTLAWRDAMDKGIVDRYALMKRWSGVMDERERPEHVAMQDETVPFDQPYSNGEMTPGESTYNCRCLSVVFVA